MLPPSGSARTSRSSVIDTGIGIEPEFLPHVFDRFAPGRPRAGAARATAGWASGLAPSSSTSPRCTAAPVRGQAKPRRRARGGDVRRDACRSPSSTPSRRGMCGPRNPILPVEDSMEGALAGLKVLVVDDEPDARQLLRHVLADCHAELALAASAAVALKLVERFRPDVIVSDVGVPEQDGAWCSFAGGRAVLPRRSQVPAAALTAFARIEDRKRALLAGFQMHLAKPVDPAELTAAVASLAGRTGTRSLHKQGRA